MHIVSTSSEYQTEKIGEELAQYLWAGSIILLSGDLGVGKTAFARGVARGLGIEEPITSPTYTLIHEYSGRLPLYHFDVYRLNHAEDMEDIGYEEYFYGDGVTMIEWPQRIREILPEAYLTVEILKTENDNERNIFFQSMGSKYVELLKELNIV
jgi:tRNA threonylcarbamoyladenosine biosynthesis protein TsaE